MTTKSYTSSPHLDQALAGFGAGLVSTVILHPLDVIKIRFQVDERKKSEQRPLIGGTVRSFKKIVRNEGVWRGLYRGVTPNIAGATASWSLYFWWYSLIKKHMTKNEEGKLSPFQHLTASAEAGAITAVFTNPLWVIKTRMCTTTRYTPNAYTGLLNGLRRLATEEGIAGLYRGMVPALFGVSHGAIQFMAYEEMKKWRKDIREKEGLAGLDAERLSTAEYLVMAATSKVTATVATYPYQVLRSRFQSQTTQDKYKGVMDCVRQIYRAEGYVGFYKGLSPNIIRVLPGTCITFVVYERVSQYLRENATEHSV
ncbi:hypothetical protein INT43_007043 [Umbelopsis isabellina]|uniref:Uncharacterized protein n=1 Tax=Mortierella isabellina TaxID=91625 RepID=A0A8H7PZS0_MORIS|nr:hypothetical protein INT43_007043 [Umbelopsis isabellina]